MRKTIFSVIMLVIVALALGPFAAGVWFQKKYGEFISFYNNKNIHFEIVSYKRHWFNSDALLRVTLNPDLSFPDITIEQHIQHGPIIYHAIRNLPNIFGLASIQNKIIFSPEVNAFLLLTGMPDFKIESENFISFLGNYFNYLHISGLNVLDSVEEVQAGIKDISTHFWIYPRQYRFSGQIEMKKISVRDQDDSLDIPNITIQLDQYQDQHDFWLGSGSMKVDDILMEEVGAEGIRVTGLRIEGFTKSDDDLLNAEREIKIKSIQFEDKLIGPIDIEMSLNKFDLPAVRDVFIVFRDTVQNGEIYQGQLREKVFALLPKIVTPGSSINLNSFHVEAASGKATAEGAITWPEKDFLPPSDLHDVIMSAEAKFDLNISKKLMKEVIKLASTVPDFVRDVAEPERPLLFDARNQMESAMQKNLFFIEELSSRDYISKQAEDTLVDIQRNLVPMDEYMKTVRDLFLDRQISLVVSYQLC